MHRVQDGMGWETFKKIYEGNLLQGLRIRSCQIRAVSKIPNLQSSVADPHFIDADPDPACYFDADADPIFKINLEKVLK
jgi:hypothetical protein